MHRLLFEATTFYNQYSSLLSLEPQAPFTESIPPDPTRLIIPYLIENRMSGKTYGVELDSDWQAREWWRLNFIYTLLRINLTPDACSCDPNTEKSTEGASPHHQVGLRSLMTLPGNLELDGFVRYIDKLPSQAVRQYYSLDLRLGWRPEKNIEVALVGQNLLDKHHPEFGGGSAGITEIERSVYGKVTVQWD